MPPRPTVVTAWTHSSGATLLLRVLAPDQIAYPATVTLVGLPRGDRPVRGRRAVVSGILLGVVAGVAEPALPLLTLPIAAATVGLVLLLVPAVRHTGRELLLAAAISLGVVFAGVAGSARFPGGW